MRKYRVVYSQSAYGTSTYTEVVNAVSMGFHEGRLEFYDERGDVVKAFRTWVRVDRVIT